MTSLTPEKRNEVEFWPWVKAICIACRRSYWFKNAIPLDISLNRIDCLCGTKATPGAVFCYDEKDDEKDMYGND